MVKEYLNGFSKRYGSAQVLSYFQGAKTLRVLTIGEAIIDEYCYCEAIGKSSKEPMLAVKHVETERFAGGILAVANHVAGFSDHVTVVSQLGGSNSQEEFIKQRLHPGIQRNFLVRTDSPTIVKRRFIESYFFTKMLEVYEFNDAFLNEADNRQLCAALERELPNYDLVIVVDYGHGMLSTEAVDVICGNSRFLAVNAQANAGNQGYHTISRYRRADYICMAEAEAQLEARNRRGDLRPIMEEIARKLDCPRLIVTRGKHGCLGFDAKEGFFEVPPFITSGQVVDRMGAGDAFLSLTSLCLAQDSPIEIAGFIGNIAGAQAVSTVGNRTTIQKAPLLKDIESFLK